MSALLGQSRPVTHPKALKASLQVSQIGKLPSTQAWLHHPTPSHQASIIMEVINNETTAELSQWNTGPSNGGKAVRPSCVCYHLQQPPDPTVEHTWEPWCRSQSELLFRLWSLFKTMAPLSNATLQIVLKN